MQDTIQRQILNALLQVLRPIVRALLRAGIGYREFAEVSKAAFVDVATKDYGLRGRPTNISRVAVMTGLTRKEVKRLREKASAGNQTVVLRSAPMAVILHRWFTDDEFIDESGQPVKLKFEGDSPSFAGLVRKHGGDIPPGAMRTELKRISAVEEGPDGTLTVKKRNVSGLEAHEKLITGLAAILYPAALTLAHNSNPDRKTDTWIQRYAATQFVREDDIARIKRISSDRLVEFTESIDDLFSAYETLYDNGDPVESSRTVGVGVFYFEEDRSESKIIA
ncbi:MAG: DUF6502 family protein [Woeseia sp.]